MLRFLILSLLFICGPLQAAGERLLFYKLGEADAEVYLLGSMHLARADIYPLRAEIMQAFAGAGTLAVELDISGPRQMQWLAARRSECGSVVAAGVCAAQLAAGR